MRSRRPPLVLLVVRLFLPISLRSLSPILAATFMPPRGRPTPLVFFSRFYLCRDGGFTFFFGWAGPTPLRHACYRRQPFACGRSTQAHRSATRSRRVRSPRWCSSGAAARAGGRQLLMPRRVGGGRGRLAAPAAWAGRRRGAAQRAAVLNGQVGAELVWLQQGVARRGSQEGGARLATAARVHAVLRVAPGPSPSKSSTPKQLLSGLRGGETAWRARGPRTPRNHLDAEAARFACCEEAAVFVVSSRTFPVTVHPRRAQAAARTLP